MDHEKELNDSQLSKLLEAVNFAENRLKTTGRNMTIREIGAEFANHCGDIKVEFLSRGDGAALRSLMGMASGCDRKSTRRNMSALRKVLEKEWRFRSKAKPVLTVSGKNTEQTLN